MNEEGQVPTPDAQVAEGTEQEQPKSKLGHDEALAELHRTRAEAAATRRKLKDLEAAMQQQATAAQAEEAKRLAEQGEFKALYEKALSELEAARPAQQRLAALIEQTAASNQKRLDAIPAAMKSLVPEYDDPLKLAAWLDANASVLTKPAAPSLDGGAGGASSVGISDAELEAQAVRLGISPKLYKTFVGG